MALVESGTPGTKKNYWLVKAGKLKIYVPKEKSFTGGIPKIVDFPPRKGPRSVGVPNMK